MLSEFKNFALLVLAAMAVFSMAAFVMTDTALSEDWDSYSPAHAVGSGDDDWWTAYPDQHEDSGSAVEHPDWVLDALKEKPVLILIHSSNCKPCLTQVPRIETAVASLGGDLKYYDMLAEGSGYEKTIDILKVYDPKGVEDKYFVPTTIFITLAKGSDGTVDVAWHSEIDAMSQEKIDAYVKDSIYYYKQNRAAWI
ncbi:MAG: thioredoxin family protein [Methanothrix sp.]|nr:MAG: thioredoxin family protein [Methanothrix sp.]